MRRVASTNPGSVGKNEFDPKKNPEIFGDFRPLESAHQWPPPFLTIAHPSRDFLEESNGMFP